MASSCVQLCRRSTSYLRSKTSCVTLLYSTHVQNHAAGVRTSDKTKAGGDPIIHGNHSILHTRQRRQQVGVCYYSVHNASPLLPTEHKDTKELMSMDALSQIKDAQHMTETNPRLGRYKWYICMCEYIKHLAFRLILLGSILYLYNLY